MLNIISNCSHFSYIHTGFELDAQGVPLFVVRKTFSQVGVQALSIEFENISWYCKKQGINPEEEISQFYHSESYGILKFRYHIGEPGDYTVAINKYYKKISNLIDYYNCIFCTDEKIRVHGDLALRNVLFEGDTVKWIIDWENANIVMPREFDLVYCITLNCLYRFFKNKKLPKKEISVYLDLLQKIDKKVGLNLYIKNKPARWCREMSIGYIKKTAINNDKNPFITLDERTVDNFDSLLTK